MAVTLVDHSSKSGMGAKGQWTLNVFTDEAGTKYQTFDGKLASKALAALAGKLPVNLLYEKEERGSFVNNVIKAVEPANGEDIPITTTQTKLPVHSETMTKEDWALKDSAIHKMACIKASAQALTHTMPSSPDFGDLSTFAERALFLSNIFHKAVVAARHDPEDDDIPF